MSLGKSFLVQIRPHVPCERVHRRGLRARPTGRAPGPVLETEARGLTGKILLPLQEQSHSISTCSVRKLKSPPGEQEEADVFPTKSQSRECTASVLRWRKRPARCRQAVWFRGRAHTLDFFFSSLPSGCCQFPVTPLWDDATPPRNTCRSCPSLVPVPGGTLEPAMGVEIFYFRIFHWLE